MKKTIMIAAFTIAVINSKAQTEAGKMMLGGNITFNTTRQSVADKTTYLGIQPSAGYFIAENLSVGMGIGFDYWRTKANSFDLDIVYRTSYKERSFVFNPFLRKYGNLSEQFKYFGQFSLPMAFGKRKLKEDISTAGYRNVHTNFKLGATLAPGVAFFPSKNFGIEFSVEGIGYIYKKTNPEVGPSVSSHDISISTNLFTPIIGIQYYF
jgi:outer membrane protein with beta-barrel domain